VGQRGRKVTLGLGLRDEVGGDGGWTVGRARTARQQTADEVRAEADVFRAGAVGSESLPTDTLMMKVELSGFEPLTSWVRSRRSPN
jgi:hypothetical protein